MATHDLVSSYVLAKHEVVRAGYVDEIAWQDSVRFTDMTPTTFLREAAWVVLSAGMAERVVRLKFPGLGAALHDWDPVAVSRTPDNVDRALPHFGHRKKIEAIVHIASVAANLDAPGLDAALREDPEGFLRSLPYIGPVTWKHLAKNLGLPLAKADRHLARLSAAYSRSSVADLCDEISGWLGEPVSVVDVVLWRYGALHARQCREHACAGLPHPLSLAPC
jgi:hypothetical protein